MDDESQKGYKSYNLDFGLGTAAISARGYRYTVKLNDKHRALSLARRSSWPFHDLQVGQQTHCRPWILS